jgi:RNA polymerase sigma-70 factor (ECF subfamily)
MADQATFADDVMPYAKQLYAHALRMTRNPSDAEDVLQEAYLKAFRAYDTFTAGTNLRAWLYRIVTNTYINRYRSVQRRPDEIGSEDLEDFYLYKRIGDADTPSSARSAEQAVLDSFVHDDVIAAIEGLDERFCQPVLLADVEGFAYKEIAEIMDVPIGTVMSRLHRGRKQLQQRLWKVARDHGIVEKDA